ncbi:GDP-mannose 4,6-dehydratase [Candidatus Woesearchaeota archaeon]|nr:GDP-mannose 4,6-dehydratase [Candidatus Woesearchaeota archaeon]
MKVLVTGGAGFVGSHVAEFYAKKGHDVIVFDNLSRAKLLNKNIPSKEYNLDYLKKFSNIMPIKGDIRDASSIESAAKGQDAIIHTASQTAVTSSVKDPRTDFEVNAAGTFNVMEAARKNDVKCIVYCSTNKVYGEKVNSVNVTEGESRYEFEKGFEKGIPESFGIDLCSHTPYGCSKLAGDMYAQDYARTYGIKTGVFRMSTIYGARQFAVEDQGWVTWIVMSALKKRPITIYGNGKQVRDALYVTDLVAAFDSFISGRIAHGVYNMGGGPENSISILELIEMLGKITGRKIELSFGEWRPSDQRVYISDIRKAVKELKWKPQISIGEGVNKVLDYCRNERAL